MICDTIGLTADSYASMYVHGGLEVEEVYGGLNYAQPIFYKMQTITGTAPIAFDSYPGHLTDYTISGNSYQDGTPSPDDPVDVVGCGEKTENLFEITSDMRDASKWGRYGVYGQWFMFYKIPDEVFFKIKQSRKISIRAYLKAAGSYYSGEVLAITPQTFPNEGVSLQWRVINNDGSTGTIVQTIDDWNEMYLGIGLGDGVGGKEQELIDAIFNNYNIMLTAGVRYLPYEPYGYKLPITCGGTEYPIYLGQVPTTRRIKKLVLTGEEDWSEITDGLYRITVNGYLRIAYIQVGMSSHFNGGYAIESVPLAESDELTFSVSDSGNNYVYLSSHYLTTAEFKSYLAQQYANGTPVTIWYILAEPETGIVNEPLMKIGDYADTISMTQASVTIPTIAGTNTLTIDTTVQPSSVSVTGHIKPVTS